MNVSSRQFRSRLQHDGLFVFDKLTVRFLACSLSLHLSLAQVWLKFITGSRHHPYCVRGIKVMAQIEAAGGISAEAAAVSDVATRAVTHVHATAASSEAAAEVVS